MSPNDKILGTLAASFLWVVAVDLFVESQGRSQRARGIAWIAGIAVIALLFHFKWEAWLFPPLLFGSLVFAVGLAGQLRRGERNAAFWLFNHRLWLAAGLGLIGAVLFGGGLSIILETLNFLFGLELPQKWHERIWTIALGFLAPVSWLALAPQNFTDRISGEETEFTTRAVATIVKFVLVPLLLVYTAIWALILAIWRMWRRENRFDLRVIPGLLAILLLAASFGPWGNSAHRCGARRPNSPASSATRGCSPMELTKA